jgi:membrane dipeptidase
MVGDGLWVASIQEKEFVNTKRWWWLSNGCLITAVATLVLLAPNRELSAKVVAAPPVFRAVDLHCDLPYRIHYKHRPIESQSGQVVGQTLVSGKVGGVVLAIYIPDRIKPSGPTNTHLNQVLETIEKVVASSSYPFSKTPLSGPLKHARRVDYWLAIEGAEGLPIQSSVFNKWIDVGVRLVGLIHAHDNSLGGSATDKSQSGLTAKGKKMVRAIYNRNALVDVSHSSDKSFDDIAAIAKQFNAPLVATHSNARKLASAARNLSDKQLKAIGASGGVVGINFHSPFLTNNGGRASMNDVIRHIEHITKIAGEDALAIGADFEGGILPPAELQTAADFPKLAKALRRRGHSTAFIHKLFSKNARRVLRWKAAKAAVQAAPKKG